MMIAALAVCGLALAACGGGGGNGACVDIHHQDFCPDGESGHGEEDENGNGENETENGFVDENGDRVGDDVRIRKQAKFGGDSIQEFGSPDLGNWGVSAGFPSVEFGDRFFASGAYFPDLEDIQAVGGVVRDDRPMGFGTAKWQGQTNAYEYDYDRVIPVRGLVTLTLDLADSYLPTSSMRAKITNLDNGWPNLLADLFKVDPSNVSANDYLNSFNFAGANRSGNANVTMSGGFRGQNHETFLGKFRSSYPDRGTSLHGIFASDRVE